MVELDVFDGGRSRRCRCSTWCLSVGIRRSSAFALQRSRHTGLCCIRGCGRGPGEFGITVASPGIAGIGIRRVKVMLFGVPSQRMRRWCGVPAGGAPVPFLSNPGDCLVAAPVTTIFG